MEYESDPDQILEFQSITDYTIPHTSFMALATTKCLHNSLCYKNNYYTNDNNYCTDNGERYRKFRNRSSISHRGTTSISTIIRLIYSCKYDSPFCLIFSRFGRFDAEKSVFSITLQNIY